MPRAQSTSLGTTLAQRPTPLPSPNKMGRSAPTRIGTPGGDIVSAIRGQVTVPPGGVAPATIPQNIVDASGAGLPRFDEASAFSDRDAELRKALEPTFWQNIAQALANPDHTDIHTLFGNDVTPTMTTAPAAPSEPQDYLASRIPADIQPFIPAYGGRSPADVTPSSSLTYDTTPEAPQFLPGLAAPTRDTTAEAKNRNSSVAVASAFPLIAALFGGDLGAAFRATPMNIAQALRGSEAGADKTLEDAVRNYQLGQGAVDIENQRRQTGFADEQAIRDQAIREARDASLAASRAGTLALGEQKEGRLGQTFRFRQSVQEQKNFQEGQKYLKGLATDDMRAAVLSSPHFRAAYGLTDADPLELDAMATLAGWHPKQKDDERETLFKQLDVAFKAWTDPTVSPEDKPALYQNIGQILTALHSPVGAPGGITRLPMSPKDQQAMTEKQYEFDMMYDLAKRRTDYDEDRKKAYVAHLANNDKLAGDLKYKDVVTLLAQNERDLTAARSKDAIDPIKRIKNDVATGLLSPEQKAAADAAEEAHAEHINYLLGVKQELLSRKADLKKRGFAGESTPIVTETGPSKGSGMGDVKQADRGITPRTLSVPKGGPSSAGAASRSTSVKRRISTPVKPSSATATSGKPTAQIQTGSQSTTIRRPTVVKRRTTAPSSTPPVSGVTPGGRNYTFSP